MGLDTFKMSISLNTKKKMGKFIQVIGRDLTTKCEALNTVFAKSKTKPGNIIEATREI